MVPLRSSIFDTIDSQRRRRVVVVEAGRHPGIVLESNYKKTSLKRGRNVEQIDLQLSAV